MDIPTMSEIMEKENCRNDMGNTQRNHETSNLSPEVDLDHNNGWR